MGIEYGNSFNGVDNVANSVSLWDYAKPLLENQNMACGLLSFLPWADPCFRFDMAQSPLTLKNDVIQFNKSYSYNPDSNLAMDSFGYGLSYNQMGINSVTLSQQDYKVAIQNGEVNDFAITNGENTYRIVQSETEEGSVYRLDVVDNDIYSFVNKDPYIGVEHTQLLNEWTWRLADDTGTVLDQTQVQTFLDSIRDEFAKGYDSNNETTVNLSRIYELIEGFSPNKN